MSEEENTPINNVIDLSEYNEKKIKEKNSNYSKPASSAPPVDESIKDIIRNLRRIMRFQRQFLDKD